MSTQKEALAEACLVGFMPPPVPAPDVAGGQLLAMFNSLDAYGQRVALAHMAALVRIQAGGV